jgi:hypothetical protein
MRRLMFRLAGYLGMTVSELEVRCSSSELSEWACLAGLDPWGEYRADVRGAVGAWASIAAWNSKANVSDFLPVDHFVDRVPRGFVDSKPVATDDELLKAKAFLLSLGMQPAKGE